MKIIRFSLVLFLYGLLTAQPNDSLFQFLPYYLRSEEIRTMPIRNLDDLLNLYPGLVNMEDGWHLHGSRPDEIGYYLNGVNSTDPMTGLNGVYIIPEAIERFSVMPTNAPITFQNGTGGFVSVRLKRGTLGHHASFKIHSDRFAEKGNQFLSTYTYRDQYLTGLFSGPLSKKGRYFMAVEKKDIGDTRKRFSSGFVFRDLIDQNRNNFHYGGIPDTIHTLAYPDGFTPKNHLNQWAVNSTVYFNLAPVDVELTAVYLWQKKYFNDTPMLHILNQREQYLKSDHLFLSSDISGHYEKFNYRLNLNYYQRRSEMFDAYLGDRWKFWYDSLEVANASDGQIQLGRRYFAGYSYDLNGFRFFQNGTLMHDYQKSYQRKLGMAGDVIWKINKRHELRAGLNLNQYLFRAYSISPYIFNWLNYLWPAAEKLDDLSDSDFISYLNNNYGYDIRGNLLNHGLDGPKEPLFGSLYLETRSNVRDIIFTPGLVVAYYDTKQLGLRHPEAPERNSTTEQIAEQEWYVHKPVVRLNPRLGLFYRQSEQTFFAFNIGRHSMFPKLQNVYLSTTLFNYDFRGTLTQTLKITDPRMVLDVLPLQTDQVDFSVTHWLSRTWRMKLTAFYKKTSHLVRLKRQTVYDTAYYIVLSSGDQSELRGLEFSVASGRMHGWRFDFYYNYSDYKGTGSFEKEHFRTLFLSHTDLAPLDFQLKHRLTFNLDFRFPESVPSKLFRASGMSLTGRISSGHPYTRIRDISVDPDGMFNPYTIGVEYSSPYYTQYLIEPKNSSTTPWTNTFDLLLYKEIPIKPYLRLRLFAQVFNVLNTKNVRNVFATTGQPDQDTFTTNPDLQKTGLERFGPYLIDMYNSINIRNGQAYWDLLGKQLYGHPRQILLGAEIIF